MNYQFKYFDIPLELPINANNNPKKIFPSIKNLGCTKGNSIIDSNKYLSSDPNKYKIIKEIVAPKSP